MTAMSSLVTVLLAWDHDGCPAAMFIQYFDTVGWVFWPIKTVSHIIYTVLEGTWNTAQSNPALQQFSCDIVTEISLPTNNNLISP